MSITLDDIESVIASLDTDEARAANLNMLTLFKANARLWREVQELRLRVDDLEGQKEAGA